MFLFSTGFGPGGTTFTPPSSPSSLPRTALLTPLRTEDQLNRSPTARKEYSTQAFSQFHQTPDESPVVFRGGIFLSRWFTVLSRRGRLRRLLGKQPNPLGAGAVFFASRSLNQRVKRMQALPKICPMNGEDHIRNIRRGSHHTTRAKKGD